MDGGRKVGKKEVRERALMRRSGRRNEVWARRESLVESLAAVVLSRKRVAGGLRPRGSEGGLGDLIWQDVDAMPRRHEAMRASRAGH